MSHIVIIIDRAPPPTTSEAHDSSAVNARVSWSPPDNMSDQEVAQNVKRLYKQVKNLGAESE
jgi:hypothetical protein